MSNPIWHYSRNAWDTACGRQVSRVAVSTSEPREATCKKCIASAEEMGEL